MKIRDLLRGLSVRSSAGARTEGAAYAVLLLTEVRLYDPERLGRMRRSGQVDAELATEIERAYDLFLSRVGGGAEERAEFARQAFRLLAGGDERPLTPLFERLDARPAPGIEPR